jgi:thiosulfate dehydrogenase
MTHLRRSATLAALIAAAFFVGFVPAVGAQPADSAAWPQPDPDQLADGPWKEMVLYGEKLITDTYAIVGPEVADVNMRYSGNNLTCQNCHLNAGKQKYALPLIGVYGSFPTYMGRENEVRTLEERINGCFERSMSGHAIPVEGREMKAMLAYIQFLSTGIPIGAPTEGRGSPPLAFLDRAANPERGAEVYAANCALCHQADGQGMRNGVAGDAKGYLYPPLWGPDSFNDGAGMHRLINSARFIRGNMPLGVTYESPLLSEEDAWDVAAYINSFPRPHRENREVDYPDRSRKPVDAPFLPFDDDFPMEQHRLGPFQPIVDSRR